MSTAQLSTITHLATHLQSTAMQHAVSVREYFNGRGDAETLQREAHTLSTLAESLAFAVGQFKDGLAHEVRRTPALMANIELGVRAKWRETAYLEAIGMLADSEGGHAD